MKFRSRIDVARFLSEIGEVPTTFTITEDHLCRYNEYYIEFKKAYFVPDKELLRKLVDRWVSEFRWTIDITKKTFYRSISTFVQSLSVSTNYDKYEVLKGITSLRTHLYIEAEYYRPIPERCEFDIFLQYLLAILYNIEQWILHDEINKITEDDKILVIKLLHLT